MADFYQALEHYNLRCTLCPHLCMLAPGQYGECGVRYNEGGELLSMTYGRISAMHVDPIEKKPLYHYFPGSVILSVGSMGCNLHCSFCQNHQISQQGFDNRQTKFLEPEELLDIALREEENIGLAFTYNEPLMSYEYLMEVGGMAKEQGLKNVMVSNGYINPQPLERLLDVVDCFNIDLKSFSEDFYRRFTGASLAHVLRTLEAIRRSGRHLEITFLVIPGQNDDEEGFRIMLQWIVDTLGKESILHISRYFPQYKLDFPPTPIDKLTDLYAIAKEKLDFVYLGNVKSEEGCDTYCPACHQKVMGRTGYEIDIMGLSFDGSCSACKHPIAIM
jgi:pyruvate formate lyase activating enzyme